MIPDVAELLFGGASLVAVPLVAGPLVAGPLVAGPLVTVPLDAADVAPPLPAAEDPAFMEDDPPPLMPPVLDDDDAGGSVVGAHAVTGSPAINNSTSGRAKRFMPDSMGVAGSRQRTRGFGSVKWEPSHPPACHQIFNQGDTTAILMRTRRRHQKYDASMRRASTGQALPPDGAHKNTSPARCGFLRTC